MGVIETYPTVFPNALQAVFVGEFSLHPPDLLQFPLQINGIILVLSQEIVPLLSVKSGCFPKRIFQPPVGRSPLRPIPGSIFLLNPI